MPGVRQTQTSTRTHQSKGFLRLKDRLVEDLLEISQLNLLGSTRNVNLEIYDKFSYLRLLFRRNKIFSIVIEDLYLYGSKCVV